MVKEREGERGSEREREREREGERERAREREGDQILDHPRFWRERKSQELEPISHSLLHGPYFMGFLDLPPFSTNSIL
jgi:hypothetical protein